jgi:hypothetical protein
MCSDEAELVNLIIHVPKTCGTNLAVFEECSLVFEVLPTSMVIRLHVLAGTGRHSKKTVRWISAELVSAAQLHESFQLGRTAFSSP